MRFLSALVLGTVLWSAPAAALTYDESRHLLNRTGFGATHAEIRALMPLSRSQAVRKLIDGRKSEPASKAPDWINTPLRPAKKMKSMSEEERKTFRRERRRMGTDLQAWWLNEMATTPSPLTERMTLFWHNHFTSSLRKVKVPHLMYGQNLTLRRYAFGNFRHFVQAMAQDPAMIWYLDNLTNRRGKPNENFARELMELFTLGEGQYTEQDIKEAARAFTGWSLDRNTGRFRFAGGQHDTGQKTFMGKTGAFNGHQIIDIIFQHPRASRHIVEKMWRAFVNETPEPAAVERIAAKFRADKFSIATALSETLMTDAFWDPKNRGTLVKSPVDLLVGTIRTFEAPVRNPQFLVRVSARLGQNLMAPPNVKGWPGGKEWITADTMLMRQQVVQAVTGGDGNGGQFQQPQMMKPKPTKTVAKTNAKPNGKRDMKIFQRTGRMPNGAGNINGWVQALPADIRSSGGLAALLLPVDPVKPVPPDAQLAAVVRHLLNDPAYQLK